MEDRGTLDLRVYRSGTEPGGDLGASLPLVGRARLASAEVLGSGQSEAGDLGYAYGTGTQAPETAGGEPSPLSFLRVWRHVGGRWKVAVDLQLPLK